MTFLWPHMLWTLLLLPLLVGLYLWMLRRKKKYAVRFASLGIVKEAMGNGPGIRRHIPPALILLSVGLMLLATARPMATLTLSSQRDTVILTMDISGSMRAADVDPDRLTASQEAARTFIAEQPKTTRVGVVAFAGTVNVVQQPTLDRNEVLSAIDRFGGDEPPSRIHGDLWPGNLLWTDERVWLVDPAAHGGHRETDLATLALFGGAPFLDRILAAYQEVWPLSPGWVERRPVHQLHLLLVHTALFGAAYRQAVVEAATRALRSL